MDDSITYEEVVVLVRQLSLDDRVRLLEEITLGIEREIQISESTKRRPTRGDRKSRNDYPVDETTYEGRTDAWRTFTHEDVN